MLICYFSKSNPLGQNKNMNGLHSPERPTEKPADSKVFIPFFTSTFFLINSGNGFPEPIHP
jgi:hypothetical protein